MEIRLLDDPSTDVTEEEAFLGSLADELEAVRSSREGTAPRRYEALVGVEHDHRVVGPGSRMHGVVDVHQAAGIDLHSVAVAVPDPRGQVAPVVMDLVLVISGLDGR